MSKSRRPAALKLINYPSLFLLISLALMLVACSAPAASPFNRALDGVGGAQALLALDAFEVSASGDTFASHMGTRPRDVKITSAYERDYVVRLDGFAIRNEVERLFVYEPRHGFPVQAYRVVIASGAGGVTAGANPLGLPGGPLPSQSVAAKEQAMRLMNPQLLLLEALQGDRDVSEAGAASLDSRPHQILTLSDAVAPIRLFVSDETGRISRLETLTNSVLLRDAELVVTYEDWRLAETVWFPTAYEVTIGGNLLRRERLAVVSESPVIAAGTFSIPGGRPTQPIDPAAIRFGRDTFHIHDEFFEVAGMYYAEGAAYATTELAPGIFLIQDTQASGLASMAIEHNGGIIALEAHTSPRAADLLIDAIQAAIPSQRITHLIQSHHHVDHSSGVRSFAAAEANLVVGHSVGDWWREVLSARSTIRPDTLSATDVPIALEELERGGELTVVDESVQVTAHHVAENSHASDMVMTVIETDAHVFLFQADLYNAGFGFTMSFDGPQALFAAMRANGLIDQFCASAKPLTIVPGHGRPTSLEDALIELEQLGYDVGCRP